MQGSADLEVGRDREIGRSGRGRKGRKEGARLGGGKDLACAERKGYLSVIVCLLNLHLPSSEFAARDFCFFIFGVFWVKYFYL
jgi:hypothetical protein